MKNIKKLILSTLILSTLGCSTLQQWQSNLGNASKNRTFSTRKVWVKTTTEKDNLQFRKINRMTALAFENLIIQANAMDGLVAYDKDSGQEAWRLPIENGAEPSATIIKDRLFIGASDGQFYSVNAKTGQVVWSFPTRTEVLGQPLLEEGIVYFLTGTNSLYAVDAATGKQLWIFSRPENSALSIRGGSRPAYRNGTIYIGMSDGSLVALLAKTGTIKWEKQLSRNKKFRDIDGDVLIDGDDLYVVGFDDAIYCLRAATGDITWKSDRGGFGSILLVGGQLFYATSTNEFVSLSKETGKQIWSYQLKEGIATPASLYKGLVVFGESQGQLIFLDAKSGKKISSFDPGRGIFSTPLVDEKNSRVYFISNEANLYALEARWTYPQHIPYLNQ